MSGRIITYLTFIVLAAMAIVLMLNISNLFTEQKSERYLSYNGVRGIAIEHERKLWTLNFDQQNQLIGYLNRSLPIAKDGKNLEKLPFERIVIYRFNAPDLFITPVGYENENLILQTKEWNPSGYLLDVSRGNLDSLIKSSYDP